MVCLDTDILVGLLKGDKDATATIGMFQKMGIPLKTTIITVYELLKGATSSSKPVENLRLVRDLLSNISILNLTYGSCEKASEIYVKLRSKGHIIGEFDILIAALAKYNDETLVSRDKHFQMVENINIQTW